MKKFLLVTVLLSLILVGCGKKPQPSPEEIIPEIPEPVTSTIDAPPPFYVPPIQDEESVIDSNFAEFDETR